MENGRQDTRGEGVKETETLHACERDRERERGGVGERERDTWRTWCASITTRCNGPFALVRGSICGRMTVGGETNQCEHLRIA